MEKGIFSFDAGINDVLKKIEEREENIPLIIPVCSSSLDVGHREFSKELMERIYQMGQSVRIIKYIDAAAESNFNEMLNKNGILIVSEASTHAPNFIDNAFIQRSFTDTLGDITDTPLLPVFLTGPENYKMEGVEIPVVSEQIRSALQNNFYKVFIHNEKSFPQGGPNWESLL